MLTGRYTTLLKSLVSFRAGRDGTDDVQTAVFYYCQSCYSSNVNPVARLSDKLNSVFVKNFLPALPEMDSRLGNLLWSFGGETLDNGRIARSGQMYLQETFHPHLRITIEKRKQFQNGLDKLTSCDDWEELVEFMDCWVEDGPLKNFGEQPLDLRGISETHTWYTKRERAESKRTYEN